MYFLSCCQNFLYGSRTVNQAVTFFAIKAVCAHFKLLLTLFSGDIEDAKCLEPEHRLQEQGGLTNAGFSP